MPEQLTGGKDTNTKDVNGRVEIKRGALDTLAKAGAVDAVNAEYNRREAYSVLHTITNARRSGHAAC